ncbi:MAG: hypothetical protein ACI8P3_003502 [Saprospiraceae bacterium]|jgi:hypothetical protein
MSGAQSYQKLKIKKSIALGTKKKEKMNGVSQYQILGSQRRRA